MARTIVGILRGGTSREYPLSLKTGAALMESLPVEQYEIRDVLIDRQGFWHLRGFPATAARALAQVDVVVSALHGGVGEDGTVQRLLERLGLPYTGSRPAPAAHSLNKLRARNALLKAGVAMPRALSFTLQNQLSTADMAEAVFSQFGPPYIVKPGGEGASHGVHFAETLVVLPDMIGNVLDEFGSALVEEYLFGDEASVGVVEEFRGQQLYAFPPARVHIPDDSRHLRFEHHDKGTIRYEMGSNFSHAEKKAMENLAKAAHRALNLNHFSRSDIILTKRGPVLLEINALPGFYLGASMPLMLDYVGSSTREFLEHAIELSRR